MGKIPDSKLMEQYVQGSSDAFDELFGRFERRAYAYFLKRSRSPERASDLYQELFLRLHRFRDRFDASKPFAPWFFRIASRVWLDELRRLQREAGMSIQAEVEPSEGARVERVAVAREEAQRLLGELSREQARVVLLAKVGGVEYGEIAQALGKSVDATKQIGARAMRRLRLASEAVPA